MSFTPVDLVEGLRASRRYFFKHLDNLRDDQWDWQPFPGCKSIRETLAHLIVDDRAALYSLQYGAEPDYNAMAVAERDLDRLFAMLRESHEALCEYLLTHHAHSPLDSEMAIYARVRKLGQGIPDLSSEDYFHAGQVTFIRSATDPDWDYYAAIYGAETVTALPE